MEPVLIGAIVIVMVMNYALFASCLAVIGMCVWTRASVMSRLTEMVHDVTNSGGVTISEVDRDVSIGGGVVGRDTIH